MKILIYENGKILDEYNVDAITHFPIPRVGDYIRYENINYKVRQVIHDYNKLPSLHSITIHIYCGEKIKRD